MINFAVGPVMSSESVLEIGMRQVPYFRTPEFSALMKENEALMLKFSGAPENSRAVFLTGSGTAAMDTVVMSVFSKNDKVLIVNGGSFGQRFCEICDVYEIPYDEIKLDSGKMLKAEHLREYENKGHTGFLVNMGETSTGVLYDMELIGDFCRRNTLKLVVDAISTFISDEFDMKKIGAAVFITGSQKALAVPPGISIVVLSHETVEYIEANRSKCYYLDLKSALKNGERGQTPYTPAVGILIQINQRLREIDAAGLDAEREKTAEIAHDFRKRIARYPFSIASESLSGTVTPLATTKPGVSAYRIFEELKDNYNIIVCPNGGALADKIFRVGHIGNLKISDNDKLFAAFDDLIVKGII